MSWCIGLQHLPAWHGGTQLSCCTFLLLRFPVGVCGAAHRAGDQPGHERDSLLRSLQVGRTCLGVAKP